ncbi:DUF3331 domain-containing protein [Paraburkholderia sp. 5N]|uniref:DUF3331 domain-containing protein n=1 Tax=Paraburkholderia elongata TaxID=2675747 RepID=A0A972NR53_9BURK|nr:DUF3331 domain-containing protein [Paraburkholderia elongata]NPT58218.1 DUF3331 domain-containing protein [Paraburkholderia elongata]
MTASLFAKQSNAMVWSPYLARASGSCALSGKHINLGDSVYRPRTR